jgi:hypothetical protein
MLRECSNGSSQYGQDPQARSLKYIFRLLQSYSKLKFSRSADNVSSLYSKEWQISSENTSHLDLYNFCNLIFQSSTQKVYLLLSQSLILVSKQEKLGKIFLAN